ncbi:hypothetical protein FB466_2613 [Klugiella xanthotipulae]|uniref:Uncharacterized protein n=2 Tax=Klugiella xanthotipulae TaxID=244735 RepID=A0A543HH06_9MICO|nr:hypothetical protein FB466_2613 [Klugiella xanthotipulae]
MPHRHAWGVPVLVGLLGVAAASAVMPLVVRLASLEGTAPAVFTLVVFLVLCAAGSLFSAVCVGIRWHHRHRATSWFEEAFGSDTQRVLDTLDAEFLTDRHDREGSLRYSPTAVMLVREKYRFLPEVAAHEVVRLAVEKRELSAASLSTRYGYDHPLGGVPRELSCAPNEPRWGLSAACADRMSMPTLRRIERLWRLLPYIVPSGFGATVVVASVYSDAHPESALPPWVLALASLWAVVNVMLYPSITRLVLNELPLAWYRATLRSSPEAFLDASGPEFARDITQMAAAHGVGGPVVDAVRVRFRSLAGGDMYFRMPTHIIVEVIRAAQKRNAAETVVKRASAVVDAQSLVTSRARG